MNLRKVFAILLALLVVLSFAACDSGGGGGSSDNGGTNNGGEGGNGGNGGGNGGGGTAATWPVIYRIVIETTEEGIERGCDLRFYADTYMYFDFEGDQDYAGDLAGTYYGDDPHGDGTIYVTGLWIDSSGEVDAKDYPVEIKKGTIRFADSYLSRQ